MPSGNPSAHENRPHLAGGGESALPTEGSGRTQWINDLLSSSGADVSEVDPALIEEHKSVHLQPGTIIANRFQVIQQLGLGGMGAVYLVNDTVLGEQRALKVMLPSMVASKKARTRFLEEIKISQKLANDHVVRVHDLGQDDVRDIQFFTMEYVEGKTLHRMLKEHGGSLPLDEAVDIARQLSEALRYAHQYTIHRDLKPQNVMITPEGKVKVLDFGLAKLMSPGRLTRSSMALGTAYYQSPEQSVYLRELDERADIYSLGVMLYEMVTGRIPMGNFKSPSKANPAVPKQLEDLILRCMETEASDRFESAGDVRDALTTVFKSQPRIPKSMVAAAMALPLILAAGYGVWSAAGNVGSGAAPAESEPATPAAEAAPVQQPSYSAREVSDAHASALIAKTMAEGVDAATYAPQVFQVGKTHLANADKNRIDGELGEAIARYGEADKAFQRAAAFAKSEQAKLSELEQQQRAVAHARQAAEAVGAKEHATTKYQQALGAEQAAKGEGLDAGTQVAALAQAIALFDSARATAEPKARSIIDEARKRAADAQQKAKSEIVTRYAEVEIKAASEAMAKGDAAGLNLNEAVAHFEEAETRYLEAVAVAPNREEQEAKKLAERERRAKEEQAQKERERQAALKRQQEEAEAAKLRAAQAARAALRNNIDGNWKLGYKTPGGDFAYQDVDVSQNGSRVRFSMQFPPDTNGAVYNYTGTYADGTLTAQARVQENKLITETRIQGTLDSEGTRFAGTFHGAVRVANTQDDNPATWTHELTMRRLDAQPSRVAQEKPEESTEPETTRATRPEKKDNPWWKPITDLGERYREVFNKPSNNNRNDRDN